ncbi:hypothetical protein OSB04_003400 [Centaurea solstitialis]|uniref:Retrovirus-related Pol polyprotein from transposon TNT 1-94 n=1 Tax=Centaurea solstitialis TaxID=347529 RepID=A0AA38TV21_9ASTR|nr:hypothetical protein OSB04_003400 [Centaurea solstitialis]
MILGSKACKFRTQRSDAQKKVVDDVRLKDMIVKNFLCQLVDREILKTILDKSTSKLTWESMKKKNYISGNNTRMAVMGKGNVRMQINGVTQICEGNSRVWHNGNNNLVAFSDSDYARDMGIGEVDLAMICYFLMLLKHCPQISN